MTVIYPTGFAVSAVAAPLEPIVVWVVGLAKVKSPKIMGLVRVVVGDVGTDGLSMGYKIGLDPTPKTLSVQPAQ